MQIKNHYNHDITVYVEGAGPAAEGCEVVNIESSAKNKVDCKCMKGLKKYKFCAYQDSDIDDSTNDDQAANDNCPNKPGYALVCGDMTGLGKCNDEKYQCTVTSEGRCNCKSKS